MAVKKKKSCGCGRKKNKEKKKKIEVKQEETKVVTSKRKNKVLKKVILKNSMSPGDILMLSAAVRDLKKKYGDYIEVDVRTSCNKIWDNNPYLTKLDEKDPDVTVIKAEYPLIHQSNTVPYHFIHGFAMHLEEKLGLNFPVTAFKGDIHISSKEKSWISQIEEMGIKDDFWLIFAGGKYDFTAKWWHPDRYQEVIDAFRGKITFVQVGEEKHWHTPLKNCINLVGKTDLRQLIRLVYHSVGVLGPVSFGMHAAAAVPIKHGRPKNRAGVIVAGAREPAQWEAYPHHRYLSNNGALMCADHGGCWKSRCTKIKDNDKKNVEKTCVKPVEITVLGDYPKDKIDGNLMIPKCLDMIKTEHVVDAIQSYYIGGALEYGSSIPNNVPDKAKDFITLG